MRPALPRLLVSLLPCLGCFVDEGLPAASDATSTSSSSTGEPDDPTGDPMCGDGLLAGSELCDDGPLNTLYGACGPVCLFNYCGDGYPGPADLCDDGNDVDDDACRNDCRPASCGDGVVQAGELCDDGNADEDDACTTLCAPPSCGDGVLGMKELCDLGERNSNTGHCTLECAPSSCGDGFVQPGEACEPSVAGCGPTCLWTSCGDGVLAIGEVCDGGDACTKLCTEPVCGDGELDVKEACDDGNGADGDDCTALCEVSLCGDGVVASDERCDDMSFGVGDGCDLDCERDAYFVFVTSEVYRGDTLGGLEQADERCQKLAQKAGLPGSYRAWLSDGAASPATRFARGALPYVLPGSADGSGLVVAASWAELVDGALERAIDVTESGQALVGEVTCDEPAALAWTGTDATAGPQSGSDCGGWKLPGSASAGMIHGVDARWTAGCPELDCAAALHLYCVEQASY